MYVLSRVLVLCMQCSMHTSSSSKLVVPFSIFAPMPLSKLLYRSFTRAGRTPSSRSLEAQSRPRANVSMAPAQVRNGAISDHDNKSIDLSMSSLTDRAFLSSDSPQTGHACHQLLCVCFAVDRLPYVPMCEMNMSSRAVDSRRGLQSKLRPPGARPPCSITAQGWVCASECMYVCIQEHTEGFYY